MLGQPMQNLDSGKNMQGHVHVQNLPIPGIPIQSTGQSTFVQSSQGVGMPNQYTLTGATSQAFQQGMFQPILCTLICHISPWVNSIPH